jgi:OmpA-OmpF porin, OOP family
MKKQLITALLCVAAIGFTATPTFSQGGAFGIHGTVNEYDGDWSSKDYDFYKFKFFQPGGGISFQQYLNPSFNLVEKAYFNQVQYENDEKTQGVDADFIGLNLNLKYKFNNGYICNEDAAIAPFVFVGAGAVHINSVRFGDNNPDRLEPISEAVIKANLSAGAGLLFQFSDRFGIEVSNTVQAPMYDGWDANAGGDWNDVYLEHSVGLIFGLKKPVDTDGDGVSDKKDQCQDTPTGVAVDSKGCPMDVDGDGVADYLDKCPNETGMKTMNGCPDKDKDGVSDIDDKCPDAPGIQRFAGCPDSDGDGVEDSKDKCPNQKGVDIFEGCPDTDGDGVQDANDKCPNTEKGVKVDAAGCAADTDGDGVIDSRDRCPTTKGDPNNNGCPVIKEEVKKRLKFATRGINFETGKATLKTSSYAMLDEIVDIMNQYPDYSLRMGGHTDDVGTAEANQMLSQNRVNSVKEYLVSKGVSEARIDAVGFGESKPIASNKTAAGKAQNRRVELELFLRDQ